MTIHPRISVSSPVRYKCDAKLERAGEILYHRFSRLGKNYPRSSGSCGSRVTVEDAWTEAVGGRLSITADVKVSAGLGQASDATAKKRAMEILMPLINDAKDQMRDELDRSYPIEVNLQVARTKSLDLVV